MFSWTRQVNIYIRADQRTVGKRLQHALWIDLACLPADLRHRCSLEFVPDKDITWLLCVVRTALRFNSYAVCQSARVK
jgi:hypothetical protein